VSCADKLKSVAAFLKVGDYVDVKSTVDCVWHPAQIVYVSEGRDKFIARLMLDPDNSVCMRIRPTGMAWQWQPMGLLDQLVWETSD